MATIRPFEGLRYSALAGELGDLVAPPYDVLSREERDDYAAKSEFNIVNLTLPEEKSDDRSKFVKYGRSSALLAEWRREGILQADCPPSFYRYRQRFEVPANKKHYERAALIALIKLEPYEKGVILPHEQTFPKHKEDRLRLLEATRAHLECIFGLFEDEGGTVHRSIDSSPSTGSFEVATCDGVTHQIDLIQEKAALQDLTLALAGKKVWIADGHHRYETAINFRAALGERESTIPEDFIMMALSSMSDPGLVLLATHRIVKKLPVFGGVSELVRTFEQCFDVKEMPNRELLSELERLNDPMLRVFGVALRGGQGLILTLKDVDKADSLIATPGSKRLKLLDVTILHDLIFGKLLGLHGLDFFSYTRDPEEAIRSVCESADAAFLMNPPSVEDMREIALGGEKMPQKSTFYYPKILSGLVLWSLNDFR